MNKRFKVGAAVLAVVLLAIGGAAVAIGQSGTDEASSELDDLIGKGTDDAIVARVNGEPITRRAVDVSLAFAAAGYMSIGSGDRLPRSSADDALEVLIDQTAVAQSADKAGVAASDDDISMAIGRASSFLCRTRPFRGSHGTSWRSR